MGRPDLRARGGHGRPQRALWGLTRAPGHPGRVTCRSRWGPVAENSAGPGLAGAVCCCCPESPCPALLSAGWGRGPGLGCPRGRGLASGVPVALSLVFVARGQKTRSPAPHRSPSGLRRWPQDPSAPRKPQGNKGCGRAGGHGGVAGRLALQRVQAWVQRACGHPLVKERLQVRPGGRRVNSGDRGVAGVPLSVVGTGREAAALLLGLGWGSPALPSEGVLEPDLEAAVPLAPVETEVRGGCLRPFRLWEGCGAGGFGCLLWRGARGLRVGRAPCGQSSTASGWLAVRGSPPSPGAFLLGLRAPSPSSPLAPWCSCRWGGWSLPLALPPPSVGLGLSFPEDW